MNISILTVKFAFVGKIVQLNNFNHHPDSSLAKLANNKNLEGFVIA